MAVTLSALQLVPIIVIVIVIVVILIHHHHHHPFTIRIIVSINVLNVIMVL